MQIGCSFCLESRSGAGLNASARQLVGSSLACCCRILEQCILSLQRKHLCILAPGHPFSEDARKATKQSPSFVGWRNHGLEKPGLPQTREKAGYFAEKPPGGSMERFPHRSFHFTAFIFSPQKCNKTGFGKGAPMSFLSSVRCKEKPISTRKQVLHTVAIAFFGIALGTFSKFLDTTPANALPFLFQYLDLTNFLAALRFGLCSEYASPFTAIPPCGHPLTHLYFFSRWLEATTCIQNW